MISIVASGTRGDVQPYTALGRGLQDAGYEVQLLASADFEPLVKAAGLVFRSTGVGVEERLRSDEWRRAIEGGNFLSILAHMQAEMKQGAVEQARMLPSLLEGSDLIIAGMAGLTGIFSAAEKLNIPFLQAHVFPFTPTREFPTPLVANLPFGRTFNRLSFHVMRQMFWQNFKVSDIAMRQILTMEKAPFWGPFRNLDHQRGPVLYGYSTHVLPQPRDWPENHRVTGYWFLNEPQDWQPPEPLVKFLEAGSPPVYIGFGSMGSRNPEEAGQIALDALAQSGQRGVIASGWGGLKPADLPDTVHVVTSLPHSWLFPRMAAVVHHGGPEPLLLACTLVCRLSLYRSEPISPSGDAV